MNNRVLVLLLSFIISTFLSYSQNINEIFPDFDKNGMNSEILYNPSSISNINELKNKTSQINSSEGVIYTGNPEILKKICPGIYGTIKPVGYCMIGQK